MRIYLLGFMGSGKSTMARRISHRHNIPVLDTDSLVEDQAGMTVSEIFKMHGESFFRDLEADVLRQTMFYSKAIIATGGGLPCYGDNMAWMLQHGITIYLQWPDDMLKKHVQGIRKSRPLLASLSDADSSTKMSLLLQDRKEFYEQSSITIEMKGDIEKDFLLLERACNYIW